MRYLLPKEGRFYKANLHAHSTLSDGVLTPEDMKRRYKEHGYSILAITDHEFIYDHSAMTEPDFLMINGYEAYVRETSDPTQTRMMKTAHLNFIAKTPDVNKHICVDPAYCKYILRQMKLEDIPRAGDFCTRSYTPGFINRMIREANENGYLVFYNHPAWSRETLSVVAQYRGLMGVEVYNTGICVYEGYPNDDTYTYDELLRAGQRLAAFANDDNHNRAPLDGPLDDSYGGFNMIKAEKLDYPTVIEAIEKGNFYCSTGPLIDNLYVENGVLKADCQPVREVFLITEGRSFTEERPSHFKTEPGQSLTHVEFPILPEDGYMRLEFVDHEGKKAFTRAYFTDELKD